MHTTITPKLSRKPSKSGDHRLILQVIHKRQQTELATGHRIKKEQWSSAKGIVKNHPRAARINDEVRKMKTKLEDLVYRLKSSKKQYTVKDITSAYKESKSTPTQEAMSMSVSAYLKSMIVSNDEKLKYGTLKYYKTTLNQWSDFRKGKPLDLKALTKEHLIKFRNFLSRRGLSDNTIASNRMKVLKKMVKRAMREGYISKNPFDNTSFKSSKGKREYLSEEEVTVIEGMKKSQESYQRVLDVFLFSIYTGLRFSDICLLKPQNITQKAGRMRLKIKIKKTGQELEFNLGRRAEAIVDKYLTRGKEYAFPMLDKLVSTSEIELESKISSANAYANKILKRLLADAEITKHISFHCARHTFAVLSIARGADLYVLSKVLGHTSIQTTEIYAKLVDERKDEITALWD